MKGADIPGGPGLNVTLPAVPEEVRETHRRRIELDLLERQAIALENIAHDLRRLTQHALREDK